MGSTAATLLFERLPDRLFAPLSSANRHRYWALLCRLHEKRFGPDAPLPPSQGFSVREIVQDIEDELLTQDIWEAEEGYSPETPINIRALQVFHRFDAYSTSSPPSIPTGIPPSITTLCRPPISMPKPPPIPNKTRQPGGSRNEE